MADPKPLEHIMEQAADEAEGTKISVGDLMDIYGSRSFGPIFVITGLIVVVPPLGAIPVLPAIVGAVILLFSVQMLLGRSYIWLPGFLKDMCLEGDKVVKAKEKADPTLETLDNMVAERWAWLTNGPGEYVAAVLVSILALLLIPLELVPFAVGVPGAAITMIGVALMASDGLLMMLAYVLAATALTLVVIFVPFQAILSF